jgi:hypothetical protein
MNPGTSIAGTGHSVSNMKQHTHGIYISLKKNVNMNKQEGLKMPKNFHFK